MTDTLEFVSVNKSLTKIESFTNFVSIESEEIVINKFLDRINGFTKDLDRLTDLLIELDTLLLSDFNKYTSEQRAVLIDSLTKLKKSGVILFVNLSHTTYAKGMKSSLRRYKTSLDSIKEIIDDLDTSESLKKDDDYNSIIDSLLN